MVCHRFCPQALAEALKVNQTITTISLAHNEMGKEEAEAWSLGRGSASPDLERVKYCARAAKSLKAGFSQAK